MTGPPDKGFHVAAKVCIYAFLAYLGVTIFGWLLFWALGNILVASTLGVFLVAACANALAMRIYEQGRLSDIGLAWNTASLRHLGLGIGGGVGSASIVLGGSLLAGGAEMVSVPRSDTGWGTLVFVLVFLLFGSFGEEMLFRGYGFQVLLGALGPWATILPISVLFALAHRLNPNVSALALANTAGWGVLLGYAFWRSGDLWLPIGLHAGWNWTLPLFGVNLSGFTINVTGYALRWRIGPLWSGGDYGPEAGVLTGAILVALFIAVWRIPLQRQSPLLLRARGEA